MNFVHPEFLYLAPLLAVPILIHLLNRVRYRRMRWAAIDFLLATERRAVRRARLRQILLMILRTCVLAAALGALAQPIFSGGLASLLGGSTQVAVVLDGSASMSAADASGSAFDRAKRLAAGEIAALPRGTRAGAGTFAVRYDSPFREPIQDHGAVAAAIESAELTGGATDVAQALRAAAQCLHRGGGGGTIWLLTDLRQPGWRAGGPGAWDEVCQAIQQAGKPRLIVTDAAPAVASNLSITKMRVSPEILLEDDVPRLTGTVTRQGAANGATNVSLFFDGRLVDTRSVQLAEAGSAEVVFHLPALKGGARAGYLELQHDALPADDRFYFLLRPAQSIPVLVVSGAPSAIPFEGSGDFVAAALQPPQADAAARSPFAVKSIPAGELSRTTLADFAAVCLADVPRLDPETVQALRGYVAAGGLLIVFPGPRTDVAAWKAADFPTVRMESLVQAEGEKKIKVNWTAPASPITATLAAEGLDRLAISRYFRLAGAPADESLATIEGGAPLLMRSQVGRGKVYVFAVSCQSDFSNLPFTPVLLLTIHRIMLGHLIEAGEPLALPTFTTLEFSVPPGTHRMITPDGRSLPLVLHENKPGKASFDRTEQAGIYRLAAGDGAEADKNAVPVAALNVPVEETTLERMSPGEIQALLPGVSVYFAESGGDVGRLGADAENSSAASGFPLAALALAFLLGEVLLAWSMSRPSATAAKISLDTPAPVKA